MKLQYVRDDLEIKTFIFDQNFIERDTYDNYEKFRKILKNFRRSRIKIHMSDKTTSNLEKSQKLPNLWRKVVNDDTMRFEQF